MTRLEKIELAILVPLLVVCYLLASPSSDISLGRVVLIFAATLLTQSLLRDLYLLWHKPRTPAQQTARCLCLESALGLTGVLLGALLLFSGIVQQRIVLTPVLWCAGLGMTYLIGFLSKDWVIKWHPLRLCKDKNHHNIIVAWKA